VKELILKRYKFLQYQDVVILPQGYDPQDFSDAAASIQPTHKMRVTHAGVFFGDRTPEYFLRALKKVFTEHPETKGNIEACFVGNFHDQHFKMIQHMGLEADVVTTGYLDHLQCVKYLQSSDVLWLMLKNDSQSPGKLYEYFGARKPVLACVPEGFISQTIEETGAGAVVQPDDVEAIAKELLKYFALYKLKKLPKPEEEVVNQYNRIELTRELSKIFGFLAE